MNRRGAALLLVLWLMVLVSGVAMLGLGGVRTATTAIRNRRTLLRAAWAGEACLEIVLGRAERDSVFPPVPEMMSLDSVDLGGEIWCRADVSDPAERVQLNLVSKSALDALVHDSVVVDRLMRGRPWPAIEALPQSASRWLALFTIRGFGRVNLNRAPAAVLATLPGVDEDAARVLIRARAAGRFHSLDEALAALPPAARVSVSGVYQDFANAVVLEPEQLIVASTGRVRDSPLSARVTATLVPAGSRLAVIRRETD